MTASLNGLTIPAAENQPKSPPFSFEPGSSDFSFAILAKSPPFLICAVMSFASASVFTKICRALYSLSPNSFLYSSYAALVSASVTGFFFIKSAKNALTTNLRWPISEAIATSAFLSIPCLTAS